MIAGSLLRTFCVISLPDAEGLIYSYVFDFKWHLKMMLACLDLFLDPKLMCVS